jgi:hypothetical protein
VPETVGEAVADIGNRGLEAAQIVGRARGQNQPAVGTPIPANQEGLITVVQVPVGKPVSPEAPPTAWTLFGFGPGKIPAELKDVLDGGFDEKYQWRCFREYHSHLPGAAGAATPTAPTPLPKPE